MRVQRRSWDGTNPRELGRTLRAQTSAADEIAAEVAAIVADVRTRGDAAVTELSLQFDGSAPTTVRIGPEDLERAAASIAADLRRALEVSAANVRAVSEAQLRESGQPELAEGQEVVLREVAVGSAAIYGPGGRAPYPSSVVMGVVPARVAGVERVVVASPPTDGGRPADAILAAASIAGADEVIAVGGAQAIAALAYGTESIERVDVIAGPGSPWVQEAKLQCSRVTGIDGYAGPSELLVICDRHAPSEWIALDICAQAEHGDDGLLVVLATDEPMLEELSGTIERFAAERESVADAAVTLISVDGIDEAIELAQAIAPEHLELIAERADEVADRLTTAGCVFVGERSATAFGDYAAGSNHVLPTGGAGRFTGPLGPADFRRRLSRVTIGKAGADGLAGTVDVIARSEGFPVHGESAIARRNALPGGE